MDELGKLKNQYVRALQDRKRVLEREIRQIDRELGSLVTGTPVVKRRAPQQHVSPKLNPSNEELFAAILPACSHSEGKSAKELYEVLEAKGLSFAGNSPLIAFSQRLTTDKQARLVFNRRDGWKLNPTQSKQIFHVGG